MSMLKGALDHHLKSLTRHTNDHVLERRVEGDAPMLQREVMLVLQIELPHPLADT